MIYRNSTHQRTRMHYVSWCAVGFNIDTCRQGHAMVSILECLLPGVWLLINAFNQLRECTRPETLIMIITIFQHCCISPRRFFASMNTGGKRCLQVIQSSSFGKQSIFLIMWYRFGMLHKAWRWVESRTMRTTWTSTWHAEMNRGFVFKTYIIYIYLHNIDLYMYFVSTVTFLSEVLSFFWLHLSSFVLPSIVRR